MEEGTTRASLAPDSGERFLPLRRELGISSFGFNQLILTAGQRGRIHRHADQEEVYIVLEGTLSLLIEGEEETLGPGEVIRVAPSVRRQLLNRGPDPLRLIALGGSGEHAGRDGEAFTSWDQTEGAPPQEVPLPEDLPAD